MIPDNSKLLVGFSRSKKIDVWTYSDPLKSKIIISRLQIPDESAKIKEDINIDVFISEHHGQMIFTAKNSVYGLDLSNSDINKLRADVNHILFQQVHALSGGIWEDWIEVISSSKDGYIDHSGNRSEVKSASLTISYKLIKKVIFDHQEFIINTNNVLVDFPKPKNYGVDLRDYEKENQATLQEYVLMKRDDRPKDASYAYIKDTPENRAALDDLISRMNDLQAGIFDFMQQDKINHFINEVNQRAAALPSPSKFNP